MAAFKFVAEDVKSLIPGPADVGIEQRVITLVQWLKLLLETTVTIIITMGVFIAGYHLFRSLIPPEIGSYNRIRLILAPYLALALEFQLGTDILSTAIAPSWDQIGNWLLSPLCAPPPIISSPVK